MNETLRQKRAKPSLSLTYSYLCAFCEIVEEAPIDLKCTQCGMPMLSLSKLYRFAAQKVHENLEAAMVSQKTKAPARGDAQPGPQGDINAAYLTEFRRA